jgi:hypothetical protein
MIDSIRSQSVGIIIQLHVAGHTCIHTIRDTALAHTIPRK